MGRGTAAQDEGLEREADLRGLLRLVARRDSAALQSFYDATSPRVHGLVLRILGDAGAAEEVTLDVYLQVWNQAQSYSAERGTPAAWLLAMARSRAIDRLRSRLGRQAREERLERALDPAETASGPLARAAESERRARVVEAVDSLPPEQREAILLAFFGGLSHAEAARKLGEPLGTVKTRIRLGMLKLRERLRAFEDSP